MSAPVAYRQPLHRVIGYRPPIFGRIARRTIFSVFLAMVVSPPAMVITGGPGKQDWLGFVISPGWSAGWLLSSGQSCGGLIDCVTQALNAAGRAMEIAFVVNVTYYSVLIYGFVTVRSVLRKKMGLSDCPKYSP